MFEFATRWLVCLVLLAVVVQSERTIKGMTDSLFENGRQCLSGCSSTCVWPFVRLLLWGGSKYGN